MTKTAPKDTRPQFIEVYSQINLQAYESLKELLFKLVQGVFHIQVPPGCKRQIVSISHILASTSEDSSKFRLFFQLDNKRIEFSAAEELDLERPVVFVPHKDSNALVPKLCKQLNELASSVESHYKSNYDQNAQSKK